MVPNHGNFGEKVTFDISTTRHMAQINLKISDELNARIENESGGKRERAGWIRDLIRNEIGPDYDPEPDTGNYPVNERDRKIYESLLNHGSEDVLTGYVRLDDVKPEIAEECQVGKDAIYQSLKRMERHCHVRLEHGMFAGDPIRIRARPPQADPDMWTRAKGRDRDPIESLPESSHETSYAKRKLIEDLQEKADDELDQITNAEVPADD